MDDIEARSETLSARQLEEFERNGYVVVKGAFSTQTAKECENSILDMLENECKFSRRSPPMARFILTRRASVIFDRMITPTLTRALDRLFGTDGWDRTHFATHGDFFITFPGFISTSKRPLHLVGRWHVDLGFRQAESHDVTERNCAFVPAFLVTESKLDGACTLVAAGSHKVVARLLGATREPVRRQDMVAFCEGYVARREGRASVVQLTGDAGDVVVMHPLLMHAASANCRDNVRIMGNTGIGGIGKRLLSDNDEGRSIADEVIRRELVSVRSKPRHDRLLKLALGLNRYFWALHYKLYDRWKAEGETARRGKTSFIHWRLVPHFVLKPICRLATSGIVRIVG